MSATEILSGNNTAQDEPESIETPLCTFDTEHEGQIVRESTTTWVFQKKVE